MAVGRIRFDAAAQQPATRGIVNITGQLYRAQNNNHYTVFLVTPEGIIMSDPINRDFSRWLKARDSRHASRSRSVTCFTRIATGITRPAVSCSPIRRSSSATKHADGARASCRQSAADADAVKMDANRNGLVERTEASGAIAERFDLFDYNRDNVVNGAEIARGSISDVYPPTTTYVDRHTVTLGGSA